MFKKLRQNRMYEEIVDQVLESIMRGDLKPGDKLPSENQLSDTFGVSRVTVREATRSLEQYGVIEVRQGSMGGAYIKEINMDTVLNQVKNALRMTNISIEKLTEARVALEQMIITQLIPLKVHDHDFTELTDNIALAESHYKNNRSEQRLITNFNFHVILAEITENPLIILMHKLILDLLFNFFNQVKPTPEMVERTMLNHKAIVKHLQKSEYSAAAGLCCESISGVHQKIAEKSKKQSLLG